MTAPEAETSATVVTKGQPDDAELAAVVAVLAAAGSSRRPGVPDEGRVDPPPVAGWSSYPRLLRRPLSPGLGAWRNSYRER